MAPARAGTLDASLADALSGSFFSCAASDPLCRVVPLPAVAAVRGSAPPAFNRQSKLDSYMRVIKVAPLAARPPAVLSVTLTGVQDQANGSGIGVDSYGASATASIGLANLALTLDPLPPSAGPTPVPPLQIVATNVKAFANYSVTVPNPPAAYGSVSFGRLLITGTLVDSKRLSFSGAAPAGTVLFSNGQVTITLNRQLMALADGACAPSCPSHPQRLQVAAIAVTLTGASVFGRPVTGSFALGEAQAGE